MTSVPRAWLRTPPLPKGGLVSSPPGLEVNKGEAPGSLLRPPPAPLFIQRGQIQLAGGPPPNLINLLGGEELRGPCQDLISRRLIRSAPTFNGSFHLRSGPSSQPPAAPSYFPARNGTATAGPGEPAGTDRAGPAREPGRPDPPYRVWPTKAGRPR